MATEIRTLAALGLKLFPCHAPVNGCCSCGNPKCDSPAKHPRITGWQEAATSGLEQLRAWWRQWPGTNYGIACGQSKITVLDVDPHHAGDESLAALERQHAPLPPTWRFLSGGGGLHIVFRDPGDAADLRNSIGTLAPGLDTRARGGFIIAPGSRHMSGRAYAIDVDFHPDDTALADMPAWLLMLLSKPPEEPAAKPPEFWRQLIGADLVEGKRNDAITKLAGHFLRRGIDPYVALEVAHLFNAQRCHPPLEAAEVTRTISSIAAKEAKRIHGLKVGAAS